MTYQSLGVCPYAAKFTTGLFMNNDTAIYCTIAWEHALQTRQVADLCKPNGIKVVCFFYVVIPPLFQVALHTACITVVCKKEISGQLPRNRGIDGSMMWNPYEGSFCTEINHPQALKMLQVCKAVIFEGQRVGNNIRRHRVNGGNTGMLEQRVEDMKPLWNFLKHGSDVIDLKSMD